MKVYGKNGFTLVELLVVISIIALLLAVLIPALSRAKNLSQRVVCSAQIKDIQTAFLAYASAEGEGKLPIGAMGAGTKPVPDYYMTGDGWSMLNYITEPAWLALTKYIKDTRTMICPSFALTKDVRNDKNFKGSPYVPTGSTWNPPAYKLGYNYHGGHFAEKWPAPRSAATKPWVSPYRISLSGSGNTILFSDMITMSDNAYGTFIAHTPRGGITGTVVGQDPMKLAPNGGGNIGKLDGSVSWKAIRDMERHHRAKNFGIIFAVQPYNVTSFGYW